MHQWQGIKYSIKDILAYIYAEGASCLGEKELNTFIKDIIAYIYVEETLCPGKRMTKYFY